GPAQAQPGVVAVQVPEETVSRLEAFRPVIEPQKRRDLTNEPARPHAPRVGDQLAPAMLEPHGGRPGGRSGRAPNSVEPEANGGVGRTALQGPKRQIEIEREGEGK